MRSREQDLDRINGLRRLSWYGIYIVNRFQGLDETDRAFGREGVWVAVLAGAAESAEHSYATVSTTPKAHITLVLALCVLIGFSTPESNSSIRNLGCLVPDLREPWHGVEWVRSCQPPTDVPEANRRRLRPLQEGKKRLLDQGARVERTPRFDFLED